MNELQGYRPENRLGRRSTLRRGSAQALAAKGYLQPAEAFARAGKSPTTGLGNPYTKGDCVGTKALDCGQTIAAKLNLILLAAVTAIFLVAGGFLGHWLTGRLEARGIAEIQHTNQQVIDMIDAYASALERSAEMLGATFAASLPQRFSVDGERSSPPVNGTLPLLRSGDTTYNNNSAPVDQFSRATGGVATLFVRQADDFFRVTTSLRNPQGDRVIGTALGKQHPAYAQVMAGKTYVGRAMLFGRDYMTRYTPIVGEGGKVIGISFIGLDFTDSLNALKTRVLAVKVGESGHVFALDAVREPGLAVIHPAAEGKNLIGVRDQNGLAIAERLIETRSGVLRYWWQHVEKGETRVREKLAVVAPFDRWGWVVATSVYADELNREVTAVQWQLTLVGLMTLGVLAGAIFWATRRWITQPLVEAMAVTQRVAAGDLTQTIAARSCDEVGRLLSALDGMSQQLRRMVSEIDVGITNLANDAHRVSLAAEAVARSSGEQSSAAAAMASTVEEMAGSIEQVTLHAESCRTMAETAGVVSASGIGVIDRAAQGMVTIAATVGQSSVAVASLGHESQQISRIVTVIREIADQTSLLALNAAIEAARAGEAGRGFAVVADEVRKLAERTAQSTREIAQLVERIQQGASHAVASMQTGEAQVHEGVDLASEASDSIKAIRAGAADVIAAVVRIADALREQNVSNQEIARNVECVAQQAEGNHAQARAATETARGMKTLSDELRESIARFRT